MSYLIVTEDDIGALILACSSCKMLCIRKPGHTAKNRFEAEEYVAVFRCHLCEESPSSCKLCQARKDREQK